MLRGLILLASLYAITLVSCEKPVTSNIPQITLMYAGPDSVSVVDTLTILLSVQDGDADLGVSPSSGGADIYVKDKRYDSADYKGYFFPELDPEILDPDKGVTAKCYLFLTSDQIQRRPDSIYAVLGDPTTLEIYVKDKAGNESNHVLTGEIRLF